MRPGVTVATRRVNRSDRRGTMDQYAVTNPATGERVKTYPTISYNELAAAIALADRAHRDWSRATTVELRAALVRRVGQLHAERRLELAEIIVREMGKAMEQALGEVDFCAAIYAYYADNASSLLADEPIALADGEARRSCAAARSASCSGSCRGTTRTTRSRASPDRTSSSATRCRSSTRRIAPSRPRRWSGSAATPLP
jgi:hypothetical protein